MIFPWQSSRPCWSRTADSGRQQPKCIPGRAHRPRPTRRLTETRRLANPGGAEVHNASGYVLAMDCCWLTRYDVRAVPEMELGRIRYVFRLVHLLCFLQLRPHSKQISAVMQRDTRNSRQGACELEAFSCSEGRRLALWPSVQVFRGLESGSVFIVATILRAPLASASDGMRGRRLGSLARPGSSDRPRGCELGSIPSLLPRKEGGR